MSKVICYYFTTESGKAPVREFIDSLEPKTQRKFFFVKGLLEEFGHRLSEPYAKYIGDGIFELRFMGREGAMRILYFFFHQDKAIFTNGFIKKSNKIPANEKDLAIERKKLFLLKQS
ncbi:MAG: type II toxin-antitoxin system RelE/ParE family toxin [Candidatus Omnitrophica bacterium]|nr:type II toxin-antitoxin system RelE/ParE family toxin [Candidatus Omnitrophota bacterium]